MTSFLVDSNILIIGAHAAVSGLSLMTRDASRYQSYFSSVQLITPTTQLS